MPAAGQKKPAAAGASRAATAKGTSKTLRKPGSSKGHAAPAASTGGSVPTAKKAAASGRISDKAWQSICNMATARSGRTRPGTARERERGLTPRRSHTQPAPPGAARRASAREGPPKPLVSALAVETRRVRNGEKRSVTITPPAPMRRRGTESTVVSTMPSTTPRSPRRSSTPSPTSSLRRSASASPPIRDRPPFSSGSTPREFGFQRIASDSPGSGAYDVDPSLFRKRDHRLGGPQPMAYKTEKGLADYGGVACTGHLVKRKSTSGSAGPGTYETRRSFVGQTKTFNAKFAQQVSNGRRARPTSKVKFPVAAPPTAAFYMGEYVQVSTATAVTAGDDAAPPQSVRSLPGYGHPGNAQPSESESRASRASPEPPKSDGDPSRISPTLATAPPRRRMKRELSNYSDRGERAGSPPGLQPIGSVTSMTSVPLSAGRMYQRTHSHQAMRDKAAAAVQDAAREVEQWLSDLNLGAYTDVLLEEGYDDVRSLAGISEQDLMQLGMKKGHRVRMMQAIQGLRDTHDA